MSSSLMLPTDLIISKTYSEKENQRSSNTNWHMEGEMLQNFQSKIKDIHELAGEMLSRMKYIEDQGYYWKEGHPTTLTYLTIFPFLWISPTLLFISKFFSCSNVLSILCTFNMQCWNFCNSSITSNEGKTLIFSKKKKKFWRYTQFVTRNRHPIKNKIRVPQR